MSVTTEQFIETCARVIEARKTSAWEESFSAQALEEAAKKLWPRASDEEWRRSDPSFIDFEKYVPAAVPSDITTHDTVPEGYACVLSWKEDGLSLASRDERVSVQLSRQLPAAAESLLEESRTHADNRIILWNLALMSPHIVIRIPERALIEKPILIDVTQGADQALYSPVFTIIVEAQADATVLHRLKGGADGEALYNEGVNISVESHAQLRFFSLHDANLDWNIFGNHFIRLGEAARVEHSLAVFGGLYAKYRVHADLAGRRSEAELFGACFPHEDQHVDMRTVQRHVHPHAFSRTLYRGAVNGDAHSVYQGLIRVEEEADETDAYLTNNNLLLSDAAQSDSIPCLEINTNELRCSHGSTTGKLNEEHVFYLRSRGYSRKEAERLLVEAHFEELVARYPEESAQDIRSILRERGAG